MASVHTASCPCGYNETIAVGGTRASYGDHSTFPFYCQQCGLVSVNIAPFIGAMRLEDSSNRRRECASPPTCPKCANKKVDQYGVPPASIENATKRVAFQAWNFKAFDKGNLCPACKQMSLVFNSSQICAD